MSIMREQVDVMCCKSVGTDLSMLDIDNFITEISQLKKEVELLEAKLRARGDGLNIEELEKDSCQSLVCVTDEVFTECLDSVRSSTDQSTPQQLLDKLSEQKSTHTQDSTLSLTLLCYSDPNPTDAQETMCESNQGLQQDESTDQTSTESLDFVCNAEEQQILQMSVKMCSVKLVDCRNLIEMTRISQQNTTAEKDQTDEDENGDDFIPSDKNSESCSDGETTSLSKERLTATDITCGETFTSQRNLTRHKRQQAETLQKLFTGEEKKLHSKVHRRKKPFHCKQCGKNFFTTSDIKAHMKTHSGEKPFHCSECGKKFGNKAGLVAHERIHTGEKPYKCPQCEKRFNHKPHLKRHEFLHTNERPFPCGECGKTFKDSHSLKSHQKTHSADKPYQCSHCDNRFRHKSHKICHERIHTGEKPYLCSQCGKTFSNSSAFGLHQRVHTGEKPYQCSFCERRFNRINTLVKHQRIHTGERPFKCSQCDKTFARSDVLRTHQRVHTGEKPYHCSICGERFAYLGSFQTHQKNHATEQTALESSS